MPILTEGDIARIEGAAAVEEAEALVAFLEGGDARRLDLLQATHVHSAVLQVLMAYRPLAIALPANPELATLLAPFCNTGDSLINDAA